MAWYETVLQVLWFIIGFPATIALAFYAWRTWREVNAIFDRTKKAAQGDDSKAGAFLVLLFAGWDMFEYAFACFLTAITLICAGFGYAFGVSHGWWPWPF